MRISAKQTRIAQTKHGSGSIMIMKNHTTDQTISFYTVERPWDGNKPFVSCIPTGRYVVRKRTGSSPALKYPDAWEVLGVPDRYGICIHVANKPTEVSGCIGPNKELRLKDEGKIQGVSSAAALERMEKFLEGETEFRLVIK